MSERGDQIQVVIQGEGVKSVATNKTHELVNSQSELVKSLIKDQAYTEGAIAGADAVRADPGASVEGLKQS